MYILIGLIAVKYYRQNNSYECDINVLMYAKLVIEAFCGNMSLTRTPFKRYNSAILCYEATHCKITAAVSILSTTKKKAIVPSPVVAIVPSPSSSKSLNISFIKPNGSLDRGEWFKGNQAYGK